MVPSTPSQALLTRMALSFLLLLLAASLQMLSSTTSLTAKEPNVTFLDLMQPAVDVDSQPSDTGDKAWCDHTAPATGNTWCCGFAIPSLLVTGNGTILALAEGRKFGCGDCSGQHDLICKRSTDNGVSWQPCASPAGKGIAVVELGTIFQTSTCQITMYM